MNILEALRDENLFAPHMGSLESWAPWETFLASAFALPIPDADLFTRCTGRATPPKQPIKEAWMIVGRRGGKSRITALIATYLACFHDYGEHLSPGEFGLVSVLATDRMQARVIMRYIQSFITDTPLLASMVVNTKAESVDLDNRITIQVTSCTIRAPRGYTVVAALCDEIAFWRSDSTANPDSEILTALRPAMSTIPNAMLICLSSPYARRGAMWEAYRKFYGQDSGDILVWRAPTWVMNPTISQSFLDREKERDPLAFQSEYAADFRSDISAALDADWIDAALCLKNLDLPKSTDPRPYVGFADMSGGRIDSATLAIAHCEPNQPCVIVDLVRRWPPPFSPESVVKQMADCLGMYGLNSIIGDNYSAELTVELFSKAGVSYRCSDDSASDLYLQAVPLFSTDMLQAPDHPVLRTELTCLERRTRASGKDLITHPPGGHDDLANAVIGAAVNARRAAAQTTHADQLLPGDWIRAAQERWKSDPPYGIPQCAIGVAARGMHDSVIALRHDAWYAPMIVVPCKEMPHGNDLAGVLLKHRRSNSLAVVDVGEPRGAQCLKHLKENTIESFAFRSRDEVIERTTDRQMAFADRRSAACWKFREALDPNQDSLAIALPDDSELITQLLTLIWKETPQGIRVISKEDAADRLGGRPTNRADAVILSWYRGDRAMTHMNEWRPDERVGPMAGFKRRPKVDFGARRNAFLNRRRR